MEKKEVRPFGMRDKLGYMMGDLGCNMSFALLNSYMMLFFVTCMKIDPKLYAAIIVIAKVWDAINDPIIGGLCDSTKPGKNGKFKPWIQWGSIPLLLASIAMFIYVPNAPYWVRVAMCLGTYCVWSVAYTSVNVPYGSLQSVITRDKVQRAELSNFRSIGAMIGQLPVMVLLPLFIYDENKQPKGDLFIWIAAVLGVIGLIAFQILCRSVTERVPYTDKPKEKFNYFKTFGSFLKNRPMMALTLSTIAFLALIMTATNSMQFLFMEYFKKPELLSIGTVLMGFPMLLAIIFIKPLVKRFSKKQICTYPFVLAIISTCVLTFVKISNPFAWMAIFAVAMGATGFYNVLIWAMVADCIDYQEIKTGRREEGSIYATYSLFRKLAQGIGSGLVALALGFTGYNAEVAVQAPEVAENIRFMTGVLPFIGSVLVFISMLLMYNIREEDIANHIEGENKE